VASAVSHEYTLPSLAVNDHVAQQIAVRMQMFNHVCSAPDGVDTALGVSGTH